MRSQRCSCAHTHAGKVYHLAEPGALSEAVLPLRPDGSVDADVMARLSVRHDDSMQNVANRLALWDRQVGACPGCHVVWCVFHAPLTEACHS